MQCIIWDCTIGPCPFNGTLGINGLTHCILVDSSTVKCWTSPFVILGVSGLFCSFYSIFDGIS